MPKIKVLIVDDSVSARQAFSRLLLEDDGIAIMGTAGDPFEAAAKMRAELPDVILLDLELPRMDGLTFLAKIMAQHPVPVVICSSHTEAGSQSAMKALEIGAAEVIAKPRLSTVQERQEAQMLLCDAVRAAAQVRGPAKSRMATRTKPAPISPGPKFTADEILPPPGKSRVYPPNLMSLVVIGASTGGTEALASVLMRLPADGPPVVIVQHMPERFTAAFARRLDQSCAVKVVEAADGDKPRPGVVYIAPGNHHTVLRRQGSGYSISIVDGPYVARHRPSVDVLFRSAAVAAGPAALGIIMTGMGDDGARGLLEMRTAGAETLAQDQTSSVVWGMPGEAVRLGGAQRQVPLDKLPSEIARFASRVRPA
ncbi:protein-glutamate methylesterase/protein-glutamine glutaminase [Tropicibacter sp. S64]|uniref:protein-glutamate methylesterase/protein-glutamine glutaminase n=1 Tax=Tropicibacter sp. S64 TaxID=3415122 RepID=UPI003C7CB684